MTEFGDRIRQYRSKNNLTQPDACTRLFPILHKDSSPNAKAVYISGLESGRSTMGQSALDFQTVMQLLGLDETSLLKMLHADQRSMRRSARAPSAVGSDDDRGARVTNVDAAVKALDQKLEEIANASGTATAKKTQVSSFDPATPRALREMHQGSPSPTRHKSATPKKPEPATKPNGHTASDDLAALVADLSHVIQKRSPTLQGMHHQTLSDFVRRVVTVAASASDAVSDDVSTLSEDLCAIMQSRSQSQQIRALPTRPLCEFVRRVVKSAVLLQEVS